MGQRLAKTPSAERCTRVVHFRVRGDDVTPDLLQRIAGERQAGRLGSVTLDCRRTRFESEALDSLELAAGVNKLVLQC